MWLKVRVGLLLCLISAAAFTGYGAYRSIRSSAALVIPEEVSAQFSESRHDAEFYLRACNGYVAIYSGTLGRAPISVTSIEVSQLRSADKALLDSGIPAADDKTLLFLLEDLGS